MELNITLYFRRARAALAAEREAFEQEKTEYAELHQRQQSEVAAMLDRHRLENEEWLEQRRVENDTERKQLAEQKVRVFCV